MQAGGRQDTPVYVLRGLQPGHTVPGPAIVLDDISTVVIEPGCTAHVTPAGDLRVDVGSAAAPVQQTPTECDPIQLAIFSHRCASLHLMVLYGGAPALGDIWCLPFASRKSVSDQQATQGRPQLPAPPLQVHGHCGADGACAAAHFHQCQYQRAPGLQLRAVRPCRRASRQRASPARAPGRHVCSHPVPGQRARPGVRNSQPLPGGLQPHDAAGAACRPATGAQTAMARPRGCMQATSWHPTTRSWRAGRTCLTSRSSRPSSTRAA